MDCIVHGVAESDMTEQLSLSQSAHSVASGTAACQVPLSMEFSKQE